MKRRWVSRCLSVGLVCLALGITGCDDGGSGGPSGGARSEMRNTILIALTLAAVAVSVMARSIWRDDQDKDPIGGSQPAG